MSDADDARGNDLLERLSGDDWRRLAPLLQRVSFKAGDVIEERGRLPAHVYFPTSGVVAVVARQGARSIEVALVGREGLVGTSALLGGKAAVNDAVVQLPCEAWRLSTSALEPLLKAHRELNAHLLRYVDRLLGQISRTALTVGHARIEQRVARWLLMAADRSGKDSMEVTHEALSRAFGVRRAGITVALHLLESKGAIRSERRLVRVLDREALVRQAMGFYEPAGAPSAPP